MEIFCDIKICKKEILMYLIRKISFEDRHSCTSYNVKSQTVYTEAR